MTPAGNIRSDTGIPGYAAVAAESGADVLHLDAA